MKYFLSVVMGFCLYKFIASLVKVRDLHRKLYGPLHGYPAAVYFYDKTGLLRHREGLRESRSRLELWPLYLRPGGSMEITSRGCDEL